MSAHPDWCARGHRCALGEHRSDPVTIRTVGGALIATQVRRGGRDHLELLTTVELPSGEPGMAFARALAASVGVAVRRVRVAYDRYAGVRAR